MMYARFMICLAIGLFGISMVLKALLDGVFLDWDMLGEMRAYFAQLGQKGRYMQVFDYEAETAKLRTRLVAVDRRKAASEEVPDLLAPAVPAHKKTFPGIWVRPTAPEMPVGSRS